MNTHAQSSKDNGLPALQKQGRDDTGGKDRFCDIIAEKIKRMSAQYLIKK